MKIKFDVPYRRATAKFHSQVANAEQKVAGAGRIAHDDTG